MKIFISTFSFFLGLLAVCQSNFKGKIVDSTGEPIPFAHVVIEGTYSGTIANAYGDFSLYLPASTATYNVEFSAVGFKSKTLDIRKVEYYVQLEEDIVSLQEVVIVPRDYARELVELAIANIEKNYPSAEEMLTGFLREFTYWKEEGNDPLYVAESVIQAVKEGYDSKRTRGNVKILEGRNYESDKLQELNTRIYAGSHHPHRFDMVISRDECLGSLNAYEYELSDTLRSDGKNIFVVEFEGRGNRGSGKLFIADISYAITRAILRFDEFSFLDDRKSLDYEVEYIEGNDGKWRLSRTSYLTTFSKQGKTLVLSSDYITTDVQPNKTQIPYTERVHYADYLLDETSAYNPEFWKNYNIILADPKVEMLFAKKDATPKSEERSDASESENENKFVETLEKIRSSFSIGYFPLNVDAYRLNYANNEISVSSSEDDQKVNAIVLSGSLQYQFKKDWFIGFNSTIPLSEYQVSNVELELLRQVNINPKGRPIYIIPKLSTGYSQLNNEIGQFSSENNFEVNGKKFDSGETVLSVNQRGFRMAGSIGLGVELGGRYILFGEVTGQRLFGTKTGLFFQETDQFFLKQRSTFLDREEGGLSISRDEPIQNNGSFSIGLIINL